MDTSMRDYIRVLFRQKWVVFTCIITLMVTVIIGLLFKTPTYTASVKLLISASKQVESPYYHDLYVSNMPVALTQAEIVKSNPVINRAVAAVGLWQKPLDFETKFASKIKQPFIRWSAKKQQKQVEKATEEQKKGFFFRMAIEDLKLNIKVEPIRDTNLFTISVTDFSPYGSAVIANVVSRSYVIFDLEQQLADLQLKYGEKHLAYLQLKDSIEKMTKSLNGEPVSDLDAIGPASVKIIEQAQVPIRPDGLPRSILAILAFIMSILLGVLLAFAFEYMDPTFKYPADVENILGLPFLGSIPKKIRKGTMDLLDEQLLLLIKDREIKTLLFTSPVYEKGNTEAIANIARSLTEKGNFRILVIDANFRRLSFNKVTNQPAGPGLVDVIEEKVTLEKSVQTVDKKITVLKPGKTDLNPITLVDSHRMSELLKEASEKYDLVIIDAPDLMHRESLLLGPHVDGVVILVNEGKTRKHVAQVMLEPLKDKKARILGVILNNRTFAIPRAIYDRV